MRWEWKRRECALTWIRAGGDCGEWAGYTINLEHFYMSLNQEEQPQAHMSTSSYLTRGQSHCLNPLKAMVSLNPQHRTLDNHYLPTGGDTPDETCVSPTCVQAHPWMEPFVCVVSLVPHLAFIVFIWLAVKSTLSEGFLSVWELWGLYPGREKWPHDLSQAQKALVTDLILLLSLSLSSHHQPRPLGGLV